MLTPPPLLPRLYGQNMQYSNHLNYYSGLTTAYNRIELISAIGLHKGLKALSDAFVMPELISKTFVIYIHAPVLFQKSHTHAHVPFRKSVCIHTRADFTRRVQD